MLFRFLLPVVFAEILFRDLCKTPICGTFLRCAFMPFRVLLARLPNSMLCLRSLRCYALNCIRI